MKARTNEQSMHVECTFYDRMRGVLTFLADSR
jgi:hypothetical protein